MNDFDELIDADVTGEGRERLRGVHDLLVQAGPPPEIPLGLQHVSTPDNLRLLKRPNVPRRVALLAAAAIVLGATFTVGFATGEKSTPTAKPVRTLVLHGTKAAPDAQAEVEVFREVSGNWPMTIHVSGLAKVAAPHYYYVYLVRDGKPWAPCGDFVVSNAAGSMTLRLTAPYALKPGDTWVVSRRMYNQKGPGRIVLRPTTA